MGTLEPPRQFGERSVVAFDFDGTLTTRDSFTAFLAWKAGPLRYFTGLLLLLPHIVAYAIHRDRGRLKAAAAARFLGGMSAEDLAADAERFAVQHAQSMFRPDAVQAWRNWRSQGALMVIVTASPEITVQPFARGLGADLLIGTRLAVDETGRITGRFESSNCRGPEKVRRLQEALGEDVALAAAYGDTSGDREMLKIAEIKGYRIFKGRP
ncbi:MAG: family hydrolase [Caulobacteraceae bacterium]|jgi:phosphatidylglycerophosphatase C|nr:family hydrolase [Caulobacteraceae bacterium]